MRQKSGKPHSKGKPAAKGKNKSLKKAAPQLRDIALPDVEGSDDGSLSDDDIAFVQQHSRQLGFLANLDKSALDRSVKDTQRKQAAAASASDSQQAEPASLVEADNDDDMEGLETYERVRRQTAKAEERKGRGLPIKTPDGLLVYQHDPEAEGAGPRGAKRGVAAAEAAASLARASQMVVQVPGISVQDDLEIALRQRQERVKADAAAAAAAHQAAQARAQAKAEARVREAQVPAALLHLQDMHNREQRVVKAREAMATAASVLLAGPEEAAAEFKVLLALLRDKEAQVQRLAMVTLLAVFKDVLPGYRIRPPSERELEVKVSKEVQKLRDYETRLLAHYQAYLKVLLAAAAPARSKAIGAGARGGQTQEAAGGGRTALVTARVAVKCMCQLLSCLAHFNYTPDLLQAVVPCMAASDPEVRSQACSAIRSLLAQPETSGKVALEAVQLVADLVRTRRCVCPPQVVQALSVLRFTEVTRRDPAEDGKRAKPTPKKGAKAPAKRPRSAIDEEVDRDFKESEAATDRRTVAALQSRMLEALFEVYFRVLKNCTSAPELLKPDVLDSNASQQASANATATVLVPAPASQQGPGDIVGVIAPGSGVPRDRLLKRHPLLYPTLEGLARYAHLISIDYFNDLMAVFHQLLRDCHLPLVEQLRVLLTVSDILRGQGEALTVDRKDFHVRLYLALLNIPLRGIAEGGPDGAPATHGGPGEGVKGEGAGPRRGEEQEEEDPMGTADLAAAAVLGLLGGGVQSERGVPLDSLTPGAPGATHERRQQQQQQGVHPVACEEPLATLLAAVLSQMMCEPKIIDMARMAAFVKRCACVALSSPTPEAMALLGCILRLLRRYPRLLSMLDWEGEAPVGGRSFLPDCPDPSEAGALAATLWELPLLAQHYHPHVAAAAKSLLAMLPGPRGREPGGAAGGGEGGLGGEAKQLSGPLARPGTLRDLAVAYEPLGRGGFLPPPPPPRPEGRVSQGLAGAQGGKARAALKRALAGPVTDEGQQLLAAHGEALAAEARPGSSNGRLENGTYLQQQKQKQQQAEEEHVNAEDGFNELQAALHQQYRVARRFEVNQALRRQQTKLVEQIKRFKVHLHQKAQEAQPQAQRSRAPHQPAHSKAKHRHKA